MFAFLLYDRDKKRVVLARDHFGIKPLYYYKDDDRIITASEIKAILAHPAITAEPDYDAICDYITYQYVLNSSTLFKNIHKLPPGHMQVIDLGRRCGDQQEILESILQGGHLPHRRVLYSHTATAAWKIRSTFNSEATFR